MHKLLRFTRPLRVAKVYSTSIYFLVLHCFTKIKFNVCTLKRWYNVRYPGIIWLDTRTKMELEKWAVLFNFSKEREATWNSHHLAIPHNLKFCCDYLAAVVLPPFVTVMNRLCLNQGAENKWLGSNTVYFLSFPFIFEIIFVRWTSYW